MGLKALGIIEAIGLNTAIIAADAAVKSANVELLGYENGKGGGRITVKLMGDVGAVQAAIAAASASISRNGQGGHIESAQVIARPHDQIEHLIYEITQGKAANRAKIEKKPEATAALNAEKPEAALAGGETKVPVIAPEIKTPAVPEEQVSDLKPGGKPDASKPKGKK
jgi:Carbon dioxide concentrating mechanism/carboxysome shell protein